MDDGNRDSVVPSVEGSGPVRADRLCGAAIAIRGETVVASELGGMARPGVPCTLGTQFQIASISKQFAAAAIMVLADAQRLSVQDPLDRWFDDCPAKWSGITLHHLLTHTAGLVHWRDLPELDTTKSIPAEIELDMFRVAPVLFPPGADYSYSSPGYVLLAHAIERCSGTPYAQFLDEALFGPLALRSTFAGNATDDAHVAIGTRSGTPVASFDLDVVSIGAGDVWSTVGDLAAWNTALDRGQILSDQARRAMLSVQAPIKESHHFVAVDGYGYGTYFATVRGRRLVFHTGDNWGFQSFSGYLPDDSIQVVALTNDDDTDLEPIVFDLLDAALDAPEMH